MHPDRPRSLATLLLGALVVLLLAESLMGWGEVQRPPLSATIAPEASVDGVASVTATFTNARAVPLPLHVGTLPGRVQPAPSRAMMLVDPSYPTIFGSYADVLALEQRVGALLVTAGAPTQLEPETAAGLLAALNATPGGTLIVAEYGSVPPSLLSTGTAPLAVWVRDGGTLIWAGGPLGFFEAPAGAGARGCCPAGLGWDGQLAMVGFPLTDPVNASSSPGEPDGGPTIGVSLSPLGAAWGTTYDGTQFGANVTELAAHGGFALGVETATAATPRTSLAYLPLGAGQIFYFGNAIWSPTGQYTPNGGLALSVDIARLLDAGVVPSAGPAFATDLAVGGGQTTAVTLPVAPGVPTVLVATCSIGGVPFWGVSRPITPGP